MTTQAPLTGLLPLNPQQLARLQAATTDFTPEQLAWVSGYFWGVLNPRSGADAVARAPERGALGLRLSPLRKPAMRVVWLKLCVMICWQSTLT
ncbi:sulfite reductase subunit alpha [Salmonella enterica subsp. arizonae]|uniref:Sulfite reductase subunit alpha n=1 Tax=Salmonella enterica subsp. arizonae TaxID=59203 RepID=A0A379S0B1_SALER|nr:sulfite reductase subunit alpha [Salmonella enterica subsp. arizonae]